MSILTIAIPVFKGRDYIGSLLSDIEKIYTQDLRVLIHENFSDEDIGDLIDKYSYPIHYKKHHQNLGLDGNVLSLISCCETEYIWFMGCDDGIFEEALEVIVNCLTNKKPSTLMLNYKSFFNDGSLQASKGIDYDSSFSASDFEEFSRKLGAQFFISSIIIKKDLLVGTNHEEYDGPYGFFHWYSFLKAARHGNICFIKETLVKHISGNESYLDQWIDLFFLNYPLFVEKYVENTDVKDIFINQNLNFSMTLNIIHKKALFGPVGFGKIKAIYPLLKSYRKFYLYVLPPLLLNPKLCHVIIYLKDKLKKYKNVRHTS